MTRSTRLADRMRVVLLAAGFAFTTFAVEAAPSEIGPSRPDSLRPDTALAAFCASNPSFTGVMTASSSSTQAVSRITNPTLYGYISNVNATWSCTAYYRYSASAWNTTPTTGTLSWGNLIASTSVACNFVVGSTDYLKANGTTDCPDTDAEYAMAVSWGPEGVYQSDVDHTVTGDFSFAHSDCGTYYGAQTVKTGQGFSGPTVGNRPGSNCDPLTLDNTGVAQQIIADWSAPSGTISIEFGDAYTNSTNATLSLSATDNVSGVSQMRFSNDGVNWDLWRSYATTYGWTIPAGDGVKTVYAQFQDANGNVSGVVSDSITLDTAYPTVDFATPNEETTTIQSTTSYTVAWAENGTGSPIAARDLQRYVAPIPAPGTCTGGSYVEDGASTAAPSPVAVSGLLPGKCYVWIQIVVDAAGNWYPYESGAVLIDTTPGAPSPPDVDASGTGVFQPATNGTVFFRPEAAGTVALEAFAADPESGLSYVRFQNLTGTGWTPSPALPNNDTGAPYGQNLGFGGGTTSGLIEVVSRNAAGIDSAVRTVSLTVDAIAPTADFASPDESTTTSQPSHAVAVAWSETDGAGSEVAATSLMRQKAAFTDGACGTFTDDSAFTAVPNAASPYDDSGLLVNTCYRWALTLTDEVGNQGTSYSGALVRDTTANHGRQRQHTIETWDLGAGDSLSVNVANGNLVLTHPIVSLPIRGSEVSLSLVYNSQDPASALGPSAPGWRLDVQRRLRVNVDGSVTFIDADGARHTFTNPQGSGTVTYTRPAALYATLTRDESATPDRFTLVYRDLSRDVFDELVAGHGLLVREEDRFGNGVAISYSGGTDRISQIVDDAPTPDRMIDFTWDGSNRLTQITDWAYVDGSGIVQTTATGSRRTYRFFYDSGTGQLIGWSDPVNTTGSCPSDGTPATSHLTCVVYQPNGLDIKKTQTVTTLGSQALSTTTRMLTTSVAFAGSNVAAVKDAQQVADAGSGTTFSWETPTKVWVERPATVPIATAYGLLAQNDPHARVQSVWRDYPEGSVQIEQRTVWDANQPVEPASVTDNYGAVLGTPARTVSYEYVLGSMGLPSKVVEPLTASPATNRWTEYVYNANNDVTLTTVSLDGSATRTITKYCYTTQSLTCSTSESGLTLVRRIDNWVSGGPQDDDTNATTDYAYDAYGRQTSVTRHNRAPDGSVRDDRVDAFVYDTAGAGNLVREIINYDDGVVSAGPVDTTAPSTPTGLSATAVGSDRIDLSWTASTDNVGVQGYKLYRGGAYLTTVGSPAWSDTGLTASTAYSYTVRAVDAAANESAESTSAGATTGSAGGTTYGADDFSDSQSGTWASADIGGAYAMWSASAFNKAGGIGTITHTASAIRYWSLPVNQQDVDYTIKVATDKLAVGAVLEAWTSVRVTNNVNEWYSLEAEFRTNQQVYLRWYYRVNGGSVIGLTTATQIARETHAADTRFNIRVQAEGTSPTTLRAKIWRDGTSEPSAWDLTASDSQADLQVAGGVGGRTVTTSSNTNYPIVFKFDDLAATSIGGGGTPDTTPPTVPTAPAADATAPNQVDLSWSASTDDAGVTSYRLYRDGVYLTQVAGTATAFADRSVEAGTAYTYTVSARDAAGNESAQSVVAVATTGAAGSSDIVAGQDSVLTDLTTAHTYDTAGNRVSTADPRHAIGDATPATRQVAFTPSDDAYVREANPSSNYGSNALINVRATGGAEGAYDAFLVFDVSGVVGAISGATLRLQNTATSTDSGRDVCVYRVPDTTWAEDTITWATKPASDTPSMACVHGTQAAGSIDFDLGTNVTGPGRWAFRITNSTTSEVPYASKDSTTHAPPQLIVAVAYGPLDADDYVTRWTYDALNEVRTEQSPKTFGLSDTKTASTTYDELGAERVRVDFNGLLTTGTEFDRATRPTRTFEDTDAGGSAAPATTSITTYDPDGQVATVKDRNQVASSALGRTANAYNSLGRLELVTEAKDSSPNVESETLMVYDALDRQTEFWVGGLDTVYTYDLGGRATKTDDGFTCATTTYDYRNLPISVTSGLNGGSCTTTGAKWRTVTNGHDGLGRLRTVTVSATHDGAGVNDQTQNDVLDSVGNRLSASKYVAATPPPTTTTFTVTRLDATIAEARPDGSTTKLTHDAAGNPTDRCYWKPGVTVGDCLVVGTTPWPNPPTQSTSATFDARNQRIQLVDGLTNGVTTYDPDHDYQPKAVYVPTGSGRELQSIYTYDTRHRLATATHRTCLLGNVTTHACEGTPTPLGSDTYGYDDNDNRTRVNESNGAASFDRYYCYDARDELVYRNTGAACSPTTNDEAYTYDDAGNRTAAPGDTFTYSADGQLCLIDGGPTCPADPVTWDVKYDTAGRTTSYAGWTYSYDSRGRMTSACTSPTCAAGSDKVEFSYDGEGHRTQIRTTSAAGAVAATDFRYQGSAIVEEKLTDATHPTGAVVRSYVVDDAGAVVKLVVAAGEPGAGTYLVTWNGHGDALGLWRVADDGSGALTLANSFTYATWGAPATATHNGSPDLGFRFLYVGEFDVQWDNAFGLGLYYMHARHYSPALGRFLQPDPDRSEANLYAYTANNPVTELDPDGTCFVLCVVIVGAILFGGIEAGSEVVRYAVTTPSDQWSPEAAGEAAAWGAVDGALMAVPVPGGKVVTGAVRRLLTKVPAAAKAAARGGENAAAAFGRAQHNAFEARVTQKPGWRGETRMVGLDGRTYKPDAVTPKGRVLELKPYTPSGRRAGRRQARTYSTQLGVRARVVYYRVQ